MATKKTTAEHPEPQTALRVCAANGANLRSDPAQSFPVVAILPEGEQVTPVTLPDDGKITGWSCVRTGALHGWIRSDLLEPAAEV